MTALPLVITNAGWAAFTAAQLGEDIDLAISSVGLTADAFVVSPTLTALPGQFRTVETLSGDAVDDAIIHLVIRDDADISYTVRGFGLYLQDGTLFAAYGEPEPIFEKASPAAMLIALDIALASAVVDHLTFGDTNFLNPPATTQRRGVVELATNAESIEGVDQERAITPSALKAALAAVDKIGTVKLWWGAAADVAAGWAICAGQTVARSDGAGNITLPDMRNRVPIGAGGVHALGALIGAFEKTVDTQDAGAHQHAAGGLAATVETSVAHLGFTYTTKSDTASGGTGKTLSVPPDAGAAPPSITDPGHAHGASIAGNTASAGSHHHEVTIDVTQPSLALHFIMRI